MAELKFELQRNPVNVVQNGRFANAYSFQAAYWENVNHTNGTLRSGATPPQGAQVVFLSDVLALDRYTGFAADNQYRRGAYCRDATKDAQAGAGFAGFWIRQTNIFTSAVSYQFEFRVRNFTDQSVSLGLPANSSYIEVRCGSGGTVIQVNSNGVFTTSLTAAADEHLYIIWYACEGLVEYIEATAPTTTTWTEVENPFGWEDIKQVIEPDELLVGVFKRFVQGLTFHSDGYSFLSGYYDQTGPEGVVNARISTRNISAHPWVVEFEGRIYFDDVQWNLSRCTVDCVLEASDGIGLFARNADAPMNLFDSYSIGGVYLGPADTVNSAGTGVTISGTANYVAWYVHDIAEKMVEWLSDGEYSFSSPDLGGTNQGYPSNGEFSQMCLISGYELRGLNGLPAELTFRELAESLLMCFGLYFTLSGTTVTMKKLDDRYDTAASSSTISNIPDLIRNSYDEIRYKTITLGWAEDNTDNLPDVHAPASWRFDQNNTSGGTFELTSEIIASTGLMNTKLGQSSSASASFEHDKRIFYLELQDHTTYTSKTIPAALPWNVATITPNCNETIFPWYCYLRHRRNIYESPNVANLGNNWTGGLFSTVHYNDFKNSNIINPGEYTTWFKNLPGTSTDLYLKWLYEFDYPLDCDTIDAIVSDPDQYIGISTTATGHTKTWLKRIERTFSNGMSKIEVISE